MLRTEITTVLERLAIRLPVLHPLFSLYYDATIEKEIALGQITSSDHVLFIGGGPFPWTAMRVAEKTGATVDILDNSREAVQTAEKVIQRHTYASQLSVIYGAGEVVDAEGYSVIYIARQAQPHLHILENIWPTCEKGARIIVRQHIRLPEVQSFFKNVVKLVFSSGEVVESTSYNERSLMFIKSYDS